MTTIPVHSPLCLPSTCPRRRWFRKVADPTSESAGRPEEAPTDSSPWALPRDLCSSEHWPPLPYGPNRDHGGEDPPPRKSGAGHANVGQPTGKAELGGFRGHRFRARAVVVGCLQCPGCCSVAPEHAGQVARGEVMARPVSRQSRKGPGSLESAVGISGWQLVKRYCGEIGGPRAAR